MIYKYRIKENIHHTGESYYYVEYKHPNDKSWGSYTYPYSYRWTAKLAIKRFIRRDKRKTTKENKYHPYP